ncbi:MAG TPA: glycosyltransferase family 4 protein [Chloroflexota bacterium]|nr:glycosyltransferase family 4 protein [Chloroflexota bacterium]
MKATLANYTLTMMRGGGETRDLNLARELRLLGVDVTLVSIDPVVGKVRYPISEGPWRLIRSPYCRDWVYRLMEIPRGGRLASLLLRLDVELFSRRLVNLVSSADYEVDILQGAGLYPAVKARTRARIPVVIRAQGGSPPAPFVPLVAQASAIIGDGWDAENFEKRTGRALVEIPGGVDLNAFHRVPSAVRASLNLGEAEVVLYVGRFAPLKNVALLIDAFAQLARRREQARLLLVGDGPLESALCKQAAALGVQDRMLFVGSVPNRELAPYYSAADVFALPSKFDNSPNAVLEAMACELPVVATNVGGVPRYVSDGETGLLVEPETSALAEALERMLSDARLRSSLAAAGLEMVRSRFSWRQSAQRLIALYAQLLQPAPAVSSL